MADRACRRRPSIDVEKVSVTAIGMKPRPEYTAVCGSSLALGSAQNDGACPVAKQDTGCTVFPIQYSGKCLGADDQNVFGLT
jgi:hypothetical protein